MIMMPSRLDRLIIELGEQAANALSGKLGDLIIGDDPAASLLAHAMQLVDASRAGSGITRVGNRIIIVTADYRQACRAGAMADERGVRDQVFIRGIDGDLDLDVFLRELRSAGGEQGGRSFALTHLPKSLDALDYFARGLARNYEEMVMIAGANTKHMTRTQNGILENSFVQVRGSRGAGKFRALIAEEPQRNVTEHRPATNDTECGRLYGVGGTFGGAKVDHGGKILAEQIVADMLTAWPAGAAAAESANDPAGLGSD
ncbi:MAG: hypothetical protein GX483_07470, partial [Actinomycetaceae bacterium]|nr:hypothetical protein [Actinomycetaceae bacterium]